MQTIEQNTRGGLGEAPRVSRSDLALYRQAIRGGYPITEEMRAQMVDEVWLLATCGAKESVRVSAVKTFVEMDKFNLKLEERDDPNVVYHEHQHRHSLAIEQRTASIIEILDGELARRRDGEQDRIAIRDSVAEPEVAAGSELG